MVSMSAISLLVSEIEKKLDSQLDSVKSEAMLVSISTAKKWKKQT